MNQAVKELKIKEASLKKICKKVGTDEWPYKKLRTLERLAKNVQGNTDHREIINELENQREQMLKDPNLQSGIERNKLEVSYFKKRKYQNLTELSYYAPLASSSYVSASSSSFPNKIVDPSSDITEYSFCDELVDPTPSSSLPNHISYPFSDVIGYPLSIDVADAAPASFFPSQISYTSSDISKYPLWDQQHGISTFGNGSLPNIPFDPFWGIEHNMGGLLEATAMNYLSTEENLMASTSGILVQENTFPVASNASVGGNMTTDSVVVERSMIETLARRQRKNTRRTFHDSSTISKEMISKYFHLPIYRAAKELRVGYTILKERCRELGIFKWPYRQLVSLEKLSGKAQEAMKELKSRREMLLRDPNLKLNPAEIRLRDSCTRKIKCREMMSLLHSPTLPIHPLHIPPLIVDPALPLTVDPPSLATEEDESFKLLVDGF
nr:protein RKD2-like [Ipomoea batatas]